MPDRICPAVQRVELAAADPHQDRVRRQPDREQLLEMDDAVLPSRKPSDLPVTSSGRFFRFRLNR